MVDMAIDPRSIPVTLIGGVLAISLGIFGFLLRKQFRDMTIWWERKILGDKAADSLGRLQTPFWVGLAALTGVAFGLLMVGRSVVGLIQLSSTG